MRRWLIGAVVVLSVSAACSARPVPHLERAMSSFEGRFEAARQLPDGDARLDAYRELRGEISDFRSSLDGEREIEPDARVRASSDYGGGIGYVRVDRRDVASVRARADRLLRSLDRYLARPESGAQVEQEADETDEQQGEQKAVPL
jgi:hypothetical protein